MNRQISVFALLVFSICSFAQNGDVEQSFKTGEDLFNKQKYLEALPYLEDAANKGNDEAQFLVGKMYHQALGVSIDDAKAIQWYKKSANQGNPKAQNNLGTMYLYGVGTNVNYPEALSLFEKASSKGVSIALGNLGIMYFYGYGVNVDYKKAYDYFVKGANQGLALAAHPDFSVADLHRPCMTA